MGQEFELKYAAAPEILDRIQKKYPDLAEISMETTYYDTPAADLSRMKWTLRRRMENGVSVCTVKTPGQDGARGEWEVRCGHITQALPELCRLGAPQELEKLAAGGLQSVCGARFTRLAGLLHPEGCTAELALDRGVLLGGGRELPFSEVEVELKSGSREAAAAFAAALARTYGLQPEEKSKYRRAIGLARGE